MNNQNSIITKKIISTVITITLIFFLSCSNEDSDSEYSRLVGTKWQTEDVVYEALYGGKAYDVYEFTSTADVENYTVKNGNVVDTDGDYKYELNYPTLKIIKNSTTSYSFTFKDSRTIVRTGANENSAYMKYIKQ